MFDLARACLSLLAQDKTMSNHISELYAKHGQSLFGDDRFKTLWTVFEALIRDAPGLSDLHS